MKGITTPRSLEDEVEIPVLAVGDRDAEAATDQVARDLYFSAVPLELQRCHPFAFRCRDRKAEVVTPQDPFVTIV